MLRIPSGWQTLALTLATAASAFAGGALMGMETPAARIAQPVLTAPPCEPTELQATRSPQGGARFSPSADVPRLSENQDEAVLAGTHALAVLWFREVREAPEDSPSVTRQVLLQRLLPRGSQLPPERRLGLLVDDPDGLGEPLRAHALTLARELGGLLRTDRERSLEATAGTLRRRLQQDDVAQVLLGPTGDGAAARSLLVLRATEGTLGCQADGHRVLRLEVAREQGVAGVLDLDLDAGTLHAVQGLADALGLDEAQLPADWTLRLASARMKTALPLLAGWDPEVPADRVPAGAYRWGKHDGHRYVGFDSKHAFQGGRHMGTRVGPDGTLQLAPGARQGVWVSRPTQLPVRFDYASVGLTGNPQGGQVRIMARAYAPGMTSPTAWQPVQRESQMALQMIAAFIQVMVWLVAGPSGGSPQIGGINFSPGNVLGMPGAVAAPQPASFTPGGYTPGGYQPWGSTPTPGTSTPGSVPNPGSGTALTPPGGLRIVSRAEWGARGSSSSIPRDSYSSITIHHTAGPASSYRGASTIQGIQSYHQDQQGWSDIGYHYLIGPDGVVYEGRPQGTLGSHSPPNNGRLGLCMVGDFNKGDTPTPQALGSLQAMLGAFFQQGISPQQVFGHKQQRSTDCPGTRLFPQIPTLVAQARSGGSTMLASNFP